MNMNSIQGIRYIVNKSPDHGKGPAFLSPAETASVQAFHEALPEYAPTALVPLPELAESLRIKAAFIKDESTRFGLKAFKGLGGSYAVFRAVCERLDLDYRETSFSELQTDKVRLQIAELHFVTATDGNHGKGVAWAAAKLGCQTETRGFILDKGCFDPEVFGQLRQRHEHSRRILRQCFMKDLNSCGLGQTEKRRPLSVVRRRVYNISDPLNRVHLFPVFL